MAGSSQFSVITDRIAGETIYRVRRLIDATGPDEIGNREYRQGIFHELRDAEESAEYWNKKEVSDE